MTTIPTSQASIAILLFVFASGIQHDCHVHLASLKKYSLPTHPLFRLMICPHYTAECVIYLAMTLAGAPAGMLCNRTLACALLFVALNLGVTAQGTRRWYASKYGEAAVRGCWNLVPWVW